MRKQKDILWKAALEQLFEEFLYFINPDFARSADLARGFEFMNKELNREFPSGSEKYEQIIVDKLVKIYLKDGRRILLHIEVQEKYNKDFSKRMYSYFNRLYDKYKMSVSAQVIFTEPNQIVRPNQFSMDEMGTSLKYQFNSYKIADHEDDYLIHHPSPFGLIVLIAKGLLLKKRCKSKREHDTQLLASKLKIIKLILERNLPKHKEMCIINFLYCYIDFEFPETKSKFDQEVNLLTNKNINDMITFEEVLIEDAVMNAELKLEEKMISRLIVNHDFSNKQIEEYLGIPSHYIRKVRAKLKSRKLI